MVNEIIPSIVGSSYSKQGQATKGRKAKGPGLGKVHKRGVSGFPFVCVMSFFNSYHHQRGHHVWGSTNPLALETLSYYICPTSDGTVRFFCVLCF
jgi:hypothetical protein